MDDGTPLLLAGDTTFETADCDCACSEAPFEMTAKVCSTFQFMSLPETVTFPLTENFHLAFSPLAPAGPVVLNRLAWERYQHFTTALSPLTQPIDYQLAEQHLLVSNPSPKLGTTRANQLTAWLHITNACNLDCPYCYVRKSSEAMSQKLGLQVVDTLFKVANKQGMKSLKLKYAGGEATLQMPLVQQLHNRATLLAQQSSVYLQEVLLTNGLRLSQRWIDWLADCNIKVMVSLDGMAPVQDKQRPLKGGGKSFELVARTIEQLLGNGIKPHVSITVTADSATHTAELVHWVLQRDLTFQLNFYRQTSVNSDAEQWAIEETAIIQGLQDAYRVVESAMPDYPLFGMLLDKVQAQAHTHTCGVNQNYAVITHQGRLAQCQMHLQQPVKDSFSDENLSSQLATGSIQNLSVDEKEGCKTCPYRYRCTGGCPIETYQATGKWSVKSPHCNIYRTLYPEVLRLEGLRLLKINGL